MISRGKATGSVSLGENDYEEQIKEVSLVYWVAGAGPSNTQYHPVAASCLNRNTGYLQYGFRVWRC